MSLPPHRVWSRVGLGLLLSQAGVLGAVDRQPVPIRPQPRSPGARALGLGGAFAALCDDASAPSWNPAGLAGIEELEFYLGAGFYHTRASDTNNDVSVDQASLVLPLRWQGPAQTVSLSWTRAYDFTAGLDESRSYSDPGSPAPFQLGVDTHSAVTIDQEGSFAQLSLGYAIEPLMGLRLGATLSAWHDELTGASAIDWRSSATTRTTLVNPVSGAALLTTEQTVTVDAQAEVDSGWTTAVALTWDPNNRFTLAAVYEPEQRLELDQTFTTSDDTGTSRESVAATIDLPPRLRLGAAVRPHDRSTVIGELRWTDLERAVVRSDGAADRPLYGAAPGEPHDQAFSVHLGYEHVLLYPEAVLALRGGAFWEQRPGLEPVVLSGAESMPQSSRLDDWYGVSIGAGLYQRSVIVDLGIGYEWADAVGAGWLVPRNEQIDAQAVVIRMGIAYLAF